jgi:hypothetical protein
MRKRDRAAVGPIAGKDKPALCDTGVAQRGLLGGIYFGETIPG